MSGALLGPEDRKPNGVGKGVCVLIAVLRASIRVFGKLAAACFLKYHGINSSDGERCGLQTLPLEPWW